MPDALNQFLIEEEAACPRCGYELRPTGSDRCPECGDRLQLSLQKSRVDRSWLVLILTLGLLAGLGVQRAVVYAALGDPRFILQRLTLWWYWGVLDALILLSPVVLIIAVKRRRVFEAFSGRVRWTLALLPGVVYLIELGWILVVNR